MELQKKLETEKFMAADADPRGIDLPSSLTNPSPFAAPAQRNGGVYMENNWDNLRTILLMWKNTWTFCVSFMENHPNQRDALMASYLIERWIQRVDEFLAEERSSKDNDQKLDIKEVVSLFFPAPRRYMWYGLVWWILACLTVETLNWAIQNTAMLGISAMRTLPLDFHAKCLLGWLLLD